MCVSDTMISVRNITKRFNNVRALAGVDLDVKKGEIFCLLGANGAGKTTLINILATLLKPDDGTAFIGGYDLNKQAGKIRGIISLTGQYAAVDGFLTGRENLKLIANLRRLKRPGEVADMMLGKFSLEEAANRRASSYSGGMRRRLDIAMSLIGKPSLLFLDEPTTGLDPKSRADMWGTIRELSGSGVTILLTTQYIEEAEQLADRVAILSGGAIAANGAVEELLELYPDAKTLEQVYLKIAV